MRFSWREKIAGRFLNKLGPGVITGASDDDPSGILTYLQAGVILGSRALWVALLTLPLMFGIQEMCGRIGFITRKGLMSLIRERYPRAVLYSLAFVSVAVITLNIGADLLAVGVVLERLTGWSRRMWLPLVAAFILFAVVRFSYRHFANLLKWLALSLLFYVATVFYLRLDWWAALRGTLRPEIVWSGDGILMLAAILGTTISPYLFFWQANEEAEEEKSEETTARLHGKHFVRTRAQVRMIGRDTFLGMLFSNLVMWFIIAAAAHLRSGGLSYITDFDQAASVLQPLLGDWAYFIFALGIIGTGLLAVPVLSGTVGYTLAEIFGWREGLSLPFRKARGFYLAMVAATIVGLLLTFSGLDPILLLIYTAVLYAVITPPLIWIILRLGNDKQLMGRNVNKPWSNALGWLAFGVMLFAAVAYLFSVWRGL